MTEYEALLLCINSANLATNMENVKMNQELVQRSREHEHDNDTIIRLLSEILEVLKSDSK